MSGAYSSVEVRTIICDTLQHLFEDRQRLAYGMGNQPDEDAKVSRAWCLGEATGVGYAVDALAEAFGFESPWGEDRPDLAEVAPDMPVGQGPTRQIVADGLVGRHANDENRTRKLTPHRHRAAS